MKPDWNRRFAAGLLAILLCLCSFSMPAFASGSDPAPEAVKSDAETPEEKPKSNMGSLMILLVLALAGGGAALYYFKFRKPKADTTGHDDLDEYDFGEDEDADEEPAEIEIHSEDGQEDET